MLRAPTETLAAEGRLELRVERLDEAYDPERAFAHLYGESPNAFWLDSSSVGGRARFSFIGGSGGPLGAVVTYDVGEGQVRVERAGSVEVARESIFDYLDREMRRLRRLSGDLPFDFDCGFAGYLGYELKADCEGDAAHRSPMPDAAFVFADRLIAFDHLERRTYVLCVTDLDGADEAEEWIEETCLRLASLPPLPNPAWGEGGGPVEFRLARSHNQYLRDIAACKRRLFAGETYEVCLTNRIAAEISGADPLTLYRMLRRINPAPYAAYLRFGDVAVLSSSPERFLGIGRDRWAEARPIKGTSRRGETPEEDARLAEGLAADAKCRAENVTIVDLLRNDLGVVCEFGTVHVPDLMRVETYETVHQLVSTVRGRLRVDAAPVDCVRACFPPGSMTGAPKVRTMEIIDGLEGEARGIYSGAIGYLGLGGGCDLSVAIRTIVFDGDSPTIGVGGAIVVDSDAEDEYREALLKGRAPMRAIDSDADPAAALNGAAPISSGSHPNPTP
ncbi:MAG TPA: aminodeoxychorismate synthase component I [Solirubrobacterales bacterium]|nr:aminodeoxychorismate synthase component I [Solirubrobacterales bacterium]